MKNRIILGIILLILFFIQFSHVLKIGSKTYAQTSGSEQDIQLMARAINRRS